MALSNIFREPRREITETLVGLVIVPVMVAFVWLAHWVAGLVIQMDKPADHVFGTFFGVVVIILASAVTTVLVGIVHGAGEGICNVLARRGVELRPRTRYL